MLFPVADLRAADHVARLDAITFRGAAIQLKHKFHGPAGADDRFRMGNRVFMDMGDSAVTGDEQHIERDEVLRIHMATARVSPKSKSMPFSGGMDLRNIRPCERWASSSASSATKSWVLPEVVSMVSGSEVNVWRS